MRKNIILTFFLLAATVKAQSYDPFTEADTALSDSRRLDLQSGIASANASGQFAANMQTERWGSDCNIFVNNGRERRLTGNLSQDLFSGPSDSSTHNDSLYLLDTRSSLKAGLFSLLIPGTGQIYNGGTVNYITAAGFLAIEAAAIAGNIIWTNKANSQTSYFEQYADGTASDNYQDGHYSVLRYALWLQVNAHIWDPNWITDGVQQELNKVFVNTGPAPWDKVDFTALTNVENDLAGKMPGSDDHLLSHGTEQYYELIGKYPQFRAGWFDEVFPFNQYSLLEAATPNSGYYMDQRGLANNYFGYAGTWLGILIANHFASAIEAAIWAHGHNKLVQTSVEVTPLPVAGTGLQTQFNLAVNF